MELTAAELRQIQRQRDEAAREARWTASGDLKPGWTKCGGCGGAGEFDQSLDEYGSDTYACSKCLGQGQLSPDHVEALVQAFRAQLVGR